MANFLLHHNPEDMQQNLTTAHPFRVLLPVLAAILLFCSFSKADPRPVATSSFVENTDTLPKKKAAPKKAMPMKKKALPPLDSTASKRPDGHSTR